MTGDGYKKLAFFFWLTALAVMGLIYLWWGLTPASIAAWLQVQLAQMGAWGPVIYMAIYALRSLILFPASILTIMGGLLFGPWWGMLYTVVGENISANFAFCVSRYMASGFVQCVAGRFGWLGSIDCAYRRHGFTAVLLMRLMFLPFDLVGYSAGACQVRQFDFALATFLGTLPGLAVFIFLGSAFTDPRYLILAAVIFIAALSISRLVKKWAPPDLLPLAPKPTAKP